MNVTSSSTKIKRKVDGKLAMSRKICWINELDNFNRSSLALERVESDEFIENRKTRKQQNFDFLPKVGSLNQTSEENVSSKNKSNRKRNRKKKAKNKHSTADLLEERNSKIGMGKCSIVSQSISDSQDEDIEFKPRLKNKTNKDIMPHNINSLNDFDELQSAYFSKENIDEESTCNIQVNNKVLKTPNSEMMKETNLMEKKIRNSNTKSLKSCNNIIFLECSQSLTDNLTPDTTGNSQGTFNIQYPFEQECMSETSIMAPSSSNKVSKHSICQTSEEKNKLKHTITSSTDQNIFQTPESKLERSSKKSSNTEKNGRESIIDLITPSPKQQSSCENDKTIYTPTPIKSNPSSEKRQIKQVMIGENNKQMFLCRSSTFTKECRKNDNSPKVQISEDHVSSVNSIRKRWTKSLGVSLLDNSGNLHLITAPQTNELLLNSPLNVIPSSNNVLHHIKDQHIFSHQQVIASTPITRQNGTAKILTEKKKSEVKSIKRTKMPNFAQIHQKAFEKLENIKEMSERKAVRAQALLSGLKPEIGVVKKSPSKSRKALHYGPTIASLIPTKIPMVEASRNIPKLIQQKIEQSKVNSCIPLAHHVVIGKQKKLPHIKKPMEKKSILKHGFKTDAAYKQKTLQKSNLKELVNKKRIVTETTEKRRNMIQNVRTNRRFELLMQMRQKKL